MVIDGWGHRYTGVMETTAIRRQGYAFRPKFDEFVRQYKIIAFKVCDPLAIERLGRSVCGRSD